MRQDFIKCQSSGGSHRMHFTDWGDADNPNVLICVHGLTRCSHDYDVLAEAMQDRYRVICPDVVGRGESDWLANKADYSYPQYVSDMVRLIAKSGAKTVHWVGTSMGGIIGMLLASMSQTPIMRMVVNDVGSFIPQASLARIAQYVGREPLFDSVDALIVAVRASSPFGPLTDAEWRALTMPLIKQTPEGQWSFRYDPAIGDAFRTQPIVDVDLSVFWNQITCPILVTRGADSDLLLKSTYEEMCAKPNVRGVEFANTGHAPMFVHANTVAAVRTFLLGE